jgi:catechol 2,3-dioxygenase-like lactoylglutathione lyase family enzyme
MIRPIALGPAHMECRSLAETVPVLVDLLAFEKISERAGEAKLKHPNTDWILIVHEGGGDEAVKQMHNHFGVRVARNAEVDAAAAYLKDHKEKYGLSQIGQPAFNHGSYSLYFLEPGTNGWEIECYESMGRKEIGRERLGAVYAPHWEQVFHSERFQEKGYVPQGFTHGTLAVGDVKASARFYSEVLGLECHFQSDHVVYTKHPKTKPYIVSAERKEWKVFSPGFRFSIVLQSAPDVAEAHRALSRQSPDAGVTELGPIQENDSGCSFLLRDPNRNCWEILAAN